MITIEQVKELRDKTGISVIQCKKALEEANGDIEKAKIILQKKSGVIANKKANRELKAGAVNAYIHNSGDVAAMVLLSSETDFVAKNEEFVKLAYDIAMHIAAMNPSFIKKEDITEDEINNAKEVFMKEIKDKPKEMKERILQGKIDSYFKDKILLEQPFIKDSNSVIRDIIESATQKFGERIEVTDFARFSVRG
ncbi:elongation factor Ts [Candidatus Campbellbacteria bacterium CG10_big_fil_rev_8_21_14_0_10_35_52]|uniref:Elongation factor Ts n=1 Tax=Candidatus Campbellbacteria bacterium CG10_big_fil_rev_8_21_14_0_10_35_52 TaxID=1974527 RepID=A0A2M6WVW5_9BACT|nr:MAG: elongation factor Ts [Candidatus Campbellbacteria bacterium CG10_big_fil_rev_8_21_14_0_10_35_52]